MRIAIKTLEEVLEYIDEHFPNAEEVFVNSGQKVISVHDADGDIINYIHMQDNRSFLPEAVFEDIED